ncbi:kinesin-domain-containing protein, partial [Nadsonia fulvescens var. elongata DSM 6958]
SRPQTPVYRRPNSALSMRSPTPTSGIRRPSTPSSYNRFEIGGSLGDNTQSANFGSGTSTPTGMINGSTTTTYSGNITFDNVFHGESIVNQTVYTGAVKNMVEMVMTGYNGTVFAYGMTGSGKTYSMQGTRENPGIIPLSIKTIFDYIEAKNDQGKFKVLVSYLEIYNEQLHDLLNPSVTNDDIKLRDDPQRGIKAIGLSEQLVNSPQELLRLISRGDSMRRTEGTEFNSRSSRSHAVVQITIECTPHSMSTIEGNDDNSKADANNLRSTISTLYLCDLAGSERAAQQSERRKEGAFINKSLLTLGTIISRLSAASTSSALTHVPYRDSKLTRLLQPALSGKSIVSILCTIHPGNDVFTESLSTLRFAARAKNIVVSVKRNEESLGNVDPKVVERLLAQMEAMKDEINELRGAKAGGPLATPRRSKSQTTTISQLEAENLILREQVEHFKRLSKVKNNRPSSPNHNYKSYISHLERQLHQQESTRILNGHYSENSQQMVTDMNEQIKELLESNKDKDRMINALRIVNKRR